MPAKAKDIRPVDITPEGPGLLVAHEGGEVFVTADQAGEALAELGWIVMTPPHVTVTVRDKKG